MPFSVQDAAHDRVPDHDVPDDHDREVEETGLHDLARVAGRLCQLGSLLRPELLNVDLHDLYGTVWYMTPQEALRELDLHRGDWWICKQDLGEWTLTADPYSPKWDWRVRVGSCKSRAVRRLRHTEATRDKSILRAQKLIQLRRMVDTMRSSAVR